MDHTYTYVNIHTHRRTGEGIEVVSVMAGRRAGTERGDDLPEAPFSIGIHPWQLGDGGNGRGEFTDEKLKAALLEIETAPAYVIGEIGLDYAIPADHGEQKTVFAAQLRIAEARALPVILHCVRAFEPIMEILSGFRLPAVVFHGFIGSREQAARAVRRGYYLSLGKRSLASPKTVEAMRNTPPDRLFLETDDSPAPISAIYARAAEILDIPIRALATQLYENYEQLVGKN